MSLEKAKALFVDLVANLPPEQWDARLAELAGGDEQLRRQVNRLLTAHREAGSFLDAPAPVVGTTLDEQPSERSGAIIGPYKLLEQIGEGGMGTVWMAEQTEPIQRRVAVKVIKAGMDSRQVLARFEAERQALALMDHPNIAKVLDAGTTSGEPGGVSPGRPFFVMELVKGTPITTYCDDKHLSVRERLELFGDVCRAVQHAHQKGIIHRDLKPSNILVAPFDGKPVVKVIDFGVAKATGQRLTDATLFTGFGAVVGTPEYMSPEQAETNNRDIDTRSDIYSLGVLLYELLTGSTPLTKKRVKEAALLEVLRVIREEEPPKPSTRLSSTEELPSISAQRHTEPAKLTKLVRGELDWIVMKALEKDRSRRYETANGLARDVERHLNDEPVVACPPSAVYRFRKFARRHKGTLTTAVLLLAVLVIGTAVSIWQAIRATRAEGLAEIRLAAETKAHQEADGALEAEKKTKAELRRTLKSEQASLHFHRISRADLEWSNNNVGRADQILDECPIEYRQWEWRYFKRLCHADLVTLSGHTQPIHGVAYDPHGRRLASASLDKSVKVWDLATGKEIRTLGGHKQTVNCVAWSPDGRLIASGSGLWDEWRPGEVKVWDATTGQELHNFTGHEFAVAGVAFSPDSQRLASANWDGTVRVWDLKTSQEVLNLHGDQVRCVAFSPDGKHLASGCHNGAIVEWDAASGKQRILSGHTGDVNHVAFSPDSQRLVREAGTTPSGSGT
jgi:serine/threonine protein kinase